MTDLENQKSDAAIFEDIQVWKDGGSSLYELLSLDNFHFHNVIELGICESGEGISEVDGRREPFVAGDILIVFPFQHHRNYTRDIVRGKCKVRWTYLEVSRISGKLGFKDLFLFEMIQEISIFGVIRESEYPELYDVLGTLLKTVIEKRGRFRTLSIYSALSLSLIKMVELSEGNSGKKVHLPDKFHALPPVLDYLNARIANGEIPTVMRLAEVAKMPISSFRRTFGTIMNTSPKKYLVYAAVQRVCFLLISTPLPISEVAEAVGFTDLSTFGRVFKTVTGTTPNIYRKRAGKYV